MKVQMQLEQAQKTIEEKDKRIEELELLVKQLSASSGTRQPSNYIIGGETYGDENATQLQYHQQQQQYYDETAVTQNNNAPLQNNIMQADTDKDLNERDEFTAEE